jgi:hypothetical protein
MFDFLNMLGNYESRKVKNYKGNDCEGNKFTLDTCSVTDSVQPYETAIAHPFYNNGQWVILQSYDTREEAEKGHNKWFNTFVNEKLPQILKDHIVGGFENLINDRDIKIERK